MPEGTEFECECLLETGIETVITFPPSTRQFPYPGDQELVAECVAQDTYQITITPNGLVPPFNITSTQPVVRCERL